MIQMLVYHRDGFSTATTSKIQLFVITVNGWKPLTIIRKGSILDVAAILNLPLIRSLVDSKYVKKKKIERTLETKGSQHYGISLTLLFCYYIATILLISCYLEI